MDVTNLPYNQLVGLQAAAGDSDLLQLEDRPELHNHLGTFHAAALFSLAEGSSAEFLLQQLGTREDIGGVVRKATCKYSNPGKGTLITTSPTPPATVKEAVNTAAQKGRALVSIEIHVKDKAATLVASFTFTWFLAPATG